MQLPTPYQEYIHLSRYARYKYDESRRETWEETVDRFLTFFKEHLKEERSFNLGDQSKHVLSDFSKEEKLVIFDFINLTLDAMINFCTLGLNKTMTNLN